MLGGAQCGAKFLLGERELAQSHQGQRLIDAGATDQHLPFDSRFGIEEQLKGPFLEGEGKTVVAGLGALDALIDQCLGSAALWLEIFEGLKIHDVGERLDRDVEDVGKNPQLVE